MATNRLKLSRAQLAAFLKDPESIRQFERLFAVADEDVSSITILVEEASTAALSAMAAAVQALDALNAIRDDLEFVALSPPVPESGAPTDATYVVLSANTALTQERVLTAGANITLTDGGPGGALTIAASGGGSSAVSAWVNFNGTGVVSIRDSFNVTSITDNGIADYTVNFTAALTADYSWSVSSGDASPGNAFAITAPAVSAPTTTAFRLKIYDVALGVTDMPYVSAQFYS